MKPAFKILLLLEVAVCFAPALLVLMLGVMMTPVQVWYLFTGEAGMVSTLMFICLVVGGLAGNIALTNVLLRILSPPSHFLGRGWTLLGIFAGGAALLPLAVGDVDSNWWRIVGWMPLLCTLHLIYLCRGFLFARRQTSRASRP
jgi:hypothetical protein